MSMNVTQQMGAALGEGLMGNAPTLFKTTFK